MQKCVIISHYQMNRQKDEDFRLVVNDPRVLDIGIKDHTYEFLVHIRVRQNTTRVL